mgnify:FL=1
MADGAGQATDCWQLASINYPVLLLATVLDNLLTFEPSGLEVGIDNIYRAVVMLSYLAYIHPPSFHRPPAIPSLPYDLLACRNNRDMLSVGHPIHLASFWAAMCNYSGDSGVLVVVPSYYFVLLMSFTLAMNSCLAISFSSIP